MKNFAFLLPVAAMLTACGSGESNTQGGNAAAGATAITGAGSSFVYPVLSAWANDYSAKTRIQVNYQSVGSGAGISQIKARTVDFGASDKPLASDELAQASLAQFPVVIGGIVPVVNISGLQPGKLRLTGPLLADIYMGKIKKWNDPSIVTANPGVPLPNAEITAVHRSDGSGTTFNFTHYLGQVSAAWKSGPGEGTTVNWTGGVGGKGNEGVANYVKQIPNSIGYVEYAYVLQSKMTYALLQNSAGNFVQPSAESFQAAADSADWTKAQDFNLVMTNAPGANAYPIAATTFVLLPTDPKNPGRSRAAIDFFRYALENGGEQAKKLDYVPLPASLVQQIETYLGQKIR